jgi:hypothetical protein
VIPSSGFSFCLLIVSADWVWENGKVFPHFGQVAVIVRSGIEPFGTDFWKPQWGHFTTIYGSSTTHLQLIESRNQVETGTAAFSFYGKDGGTFRIKRQRPFLPAIAAETAFIPVNHHS